MVHGGHEPRVERGPLPQRDLGQKPIAREQRSAAHLGGRLDREQHEELRKGLEEARDLGPVPGDVVPERERHEE